MDRSEKAGLAVAVAGHALLFGILSLGLLTAPEVKTIEQRPIEVSLAEDVALDTAAPAAETPPAESVAPDQGAPEDAAPPAEAEPEPAPEPDPAPAPPPPQPKPEPRPAPPKPQPKPVPVPKPAPAPKPVPQPKPQPRKATPAPEKAAPAKPTPAKPAPAKAPPTRTAATGAKPTPAKAAGKPAPAKPAATAKGTGRSETATAARPRGNRLGDDFLKGLSDTPSKSKSEAPRAAKIDGKAMAGIVAAIARQIQPCADRQVNPGPGANQIVTTLNLRFNADGTLSATPRVVRQTGVDDENGRYAQRVVDLGIAALKGCSPLRLPAEYYSTPNGGWNNINYRWQLR